MAQAQREGQQTFSASQLASLQQREDAYTRRCHELVAMMEQILPSPPTGAIVVGASGMGSDTTLMPREGLRAGAEPGNPPSVLDVGVQVAKVRQPHLDLWLRDEWRLLCSRFVPAAAPMASLCIWSNTIA